MSNLSANIGEGFTNAILSFWYLKVLNSANLGDNYLIEINIKQKQRSLEKSWRYFNYFEQVYLFCEVISSCSY